jgi:hypothetical protein
LRKYATTSPPMSPGILKEKAYIEIKVIRFLFLKPKARSIPYW